MAPANKMMSGPALAQWLGLGLVLLTLGGAIAFNLYLEHGLTAAREKDRLLSNARVIADNMELELTSANQALEGVRDDLPNWKDVAALQAETRYLKALTNAMPGISYIGILDAEGTLLASNLPQLIGSNFRYRAYFQTVKQHPDAATLYVSPPFKNVLGTYVINITRMIPGPHGEFAGAVTATLDPAYFKTLMRSVLYAPDA